MRVLSIGQCTIDHVDLPSGTHASRLFGGDCVYAAVGAAVWDACGAIVSVVGKNYPEEWLALLRGRGIRTDGVRRLMRRHGLFANMSYDNEGRRQNEQRPAETSDYIPRGSRARRWNTFSPRTDDATPFADWPTAVHIAGMPIRRQNAFLKLFHGRVPLVSVDLPWPPDLYRPGTLPQVDLASVVLLSEAEIRGIFPGQSVLQVSKSLMEHGARIVVVKLGRRGSIVFDPSKPEGTEVPSVSSRVVDPTGAGDAYCGGFLVGLAENGNAKTAAQYGTVSASFVIEGFGAGYGLRYKREDAELRLKQLPAH